MKNVSDKICRENKNTVYFLKHFYFRKSCCLGADVETYFSGRRTVDDNITRCMSIQFWISKAANTHSEFVIISAFRPQPWLKERASLFNLHVHGFSDCLKEKRDFEIHQCALPLLPSKWWILLCFNKTSRRLLALGANCREFVRFRLVFTEQTSRSCCLSLLFLVACRKYRVMK
jgi:hypothetical protein